MFSIKHFLLGAALSLLPISFYGYVMLAPVKSPEPQFIAGNVDIEPKTLAWNELKLDSPTPTVTVTPTPAPIAVKKPAVQTYEAKPTTNVKVSVTGPAEIISLIERYAGQYGVNKDMMIHIAQCESGFKPEAVNGPYGGIYQFVSSTWSSNRRAMGLNPDPSLRFNADEAVKTAAFKMGRDGYGAWPACQRKAQAILASK